LNSQFDSIFALASPPVRSAIHVHRISGQNLLSVLAPYLCVPNSLSAIPFRDLQLKSNGLPITRYAYFRNQHKEVIDDVVVTFFPAPKSYTGEDVFEVSVHGNPLISAKLHSFLRQLGMRDAQPGEFTQRAVLNGKLDLVQAEGINQLIHAETFGGVTLARQAVAGVLTQETEQIREQLIEILSYLEAHIDFAPDEVGDYDPGSLLPQMQQSIDRLLLLLNTYSSGIKLREGVKVALIGKPNAGKSSLYNALLRYERAIVTHIPGTTRDVLEDRLIIDGKDFVLIDTAGIRDTVDVVEKIGVQRSIQTLAQSDIICLVIDVHQCSCETVTKFIFEQINELLQSLTIASQQKFLVILSKKDLFSNDIIQKILQDEVQLFNKLNITSIHNKAMIDKFVIISEMETESLSRYLVDLHHSLTGFLAKGESPTLISARQRDKVLLAIQYLQEAENLIKKHDFPEKISSVINFARQSIQEIVGEINLDQVYQKIFSTFCIGK
jgi:tRNA modification GTPase